MRRTALVLGLSLFVASTAVAQDKPARATKPPPTHADIAYGVHERNVLDVWLAQSDAPTPVLIAIHGGGFYTGLKNVNAELLNECLRSGISVVAIAYRYSTDAIAPAPLHDIARAVQFVRSQAGAWNLDPSRFAATGSSAGGAAALWLAMHDDLADPRSSDPVARESTRLVGAIAIKSQSTYDPRAIREIFPEFDVTKHPAVGRLLGVEGRDLLHLTPEQYAIYEDCSALPHASPDDPPVLMIYDVTLAEPITTPSIGIHHPRFGTVLKRRLDSLGVPCELQMKGDSGDTPIDFLRRVFALPAPIE